MRVTARIGLSYAITLGVVGVVCATFAATTLSAVAFVQQARMNQAQVLALHQLRFAAAAEAGERLGPAASELPSLDAALRELEARTAAEHDALDAAERAEQQHEAEEKIPRIRELSREIDAAIAAGEPVDGLLAERERFIAEWVGDEAVELDRATESFLAPVRWALVVTIGAAVASLAGIGLGASRMTRYLRWAFDRLEAGAARVGRGDLSVPIDLPGGDELATLGRSLDRMMDELRRSHADVARLGAELRAQNGRLAAALAESEAARGDAERSNLAKDRFLANMSHELRTPLNAIIGYTELIAEDLEAGASGRADCDRIVSAGQGLLGLIDDLLDVAKIDAGGMTIEAVDVDLAALLREVGDVARPLAARNGNRWVVEHGALGAFRGDPLRLRQILTNLVSNACKFTRGGEVGLSARRAGRDLVVSVTDSGIGIPSDVREAIFEPFVQADSSTTRRFGGTGLGLAIVRRLVTAMAGTLTLASEVGEGSTFTVRIPSAEAGRLDAAA